MPYCYKGQFIPFPCPSRPWGYLRRLISEGQRLAFPLDKQSQANKSKEHKHAIQKSIALFKTATPISVLRRRGCSQSPERAEHRAGKLHCTGTQGVWLCAQLQTRGKGFLSFRIGFFPTDAVFTSDWNSSRTPELQIRRYSKHQFLLYAHKTCTGTMSCQIFTCFTKINFKKETLC